MGPVEFTQALPIVPAYGESKIIIPIHSIAMALGSGKHPLGFSLFSRSHRRHWPQYSDFLVFSNETTIVVGNDNNKKENTVGLINHPEFSSREQGWSLFDDSLQVTKAFDLSAQNLLKNIEKGINLTINIKDQEITTESINIQFKDKSFTIHYHWDQEDVSINKEIIVSKNDLLIFLEYFVAIDIFNYLGVQRYGGAYERHVSFVLNDPLGAMESSIPRDLLINDSVYKSKNLIWEYELLNHPKLSKWYLMLLEWLEIKRL